MAVACVLCSATKVSTHLSHLRLTRYEYCTNNALVQQQCQCCVFDARLHTGTLCNQSSALLHVHCTLSASDWQYSCTAPRDGRCSDGTRPTAAAAWKGDKAACQEAGVPLPLCASSVGLASASRRGCLWYRQLYPDTPAFTAELGSNS